MNNSQIRIAGAKAFAEKTIDTMRCMDAGDAKQLLTDVREQTKHMANLENIIKLVSGQEIGDKAYAAIEEEQPTEYVTARANGGIPVSRADKTDKVDDKGNVVYKIVWFIPSAVASRKALGDKKVNPLGEDRDSVEHVINTYDMRRNNITIRKNAIKTIAAAAKIVKQEQLDAVHKAKATKAANIYAVGQALLAKANPVQTVSVMVATPAK